MSCHPNRKKQRKQWKAEQYQKESCPDPMEKTTPTSNRSGKSTKNSFAGSNHNHRHEITFIIVDDEALLEMK